MLYLNKIVFASDCYGTLSSILPVLMSLNTYVDNRHVGLCLTGLFTEVVKRFSLVSSKIQLQLGKVPTESSHSQLAVER